jgi:hypothetical protein
MLPDRYLGIWRRDWIERRNADTGVVIRDDSPAIWFQSPCLHVDLRVDRSLQALTWTDTPLPRTQIAFAGRTEVQAQGEVEICQWHPAFAYPRIEDEIDCGYMEFLTSTHVIERGIDGGYVESWRRLNGDDEALRCLCFQSVPNPAEQCYLMLGTNYFALGSSLHHTECPGLPIFSWGERVRGVNSWRVKESLAPWWVDQEIEIDPRFADISALPPAGRIWRVPFFSAIDWHLVAIDRNFTEHD